MSDRSILTTLERVDRALMAEIEVLQDGRFQELRELQVETEEAMKGLDALQAKVSLPVLDRARVELAIVQISQRAERARALLGAALNGARNARTRIEGLIQEDAQIGAYDRSGSPVAMKNFASPYNKTL